jgi:hypothetical protein
MQPGGQCQIGEDLRELTENMGLVRKRSKLSAEGHR